MRRSDALSQPGAEVLMNGRCVGRLEYDEKAGTVLEMTWHDHGCEHDTRRNMTKLDKVMEGSTLQRFAPDLGLCVIWHGGVWFQVHDMTGNRVGCFIEHGDPGQRFPIVDLDEAAAAIDAWFARARAAAP